MNEEFNLSDRIITGEEKQRLILFYDLIPEEDVVVFIKLLKDKLKERAEKIKLWEADALMQFTEDIEKLAGDKLT